jgi:hypothetical protein
LSHEIVLKWWIKQLVDQGYTITGVQQRFGPYMPDIVAKKGEEIHVYEVVLSGLTDVGFRLKSYFDKGAKIVHLVTEAGVAEITQFQAEKILRNAVADYLKQIEEQVNT